MHVDNRALIRLSFFTPQTCPSFSSLHLFPTFISSLRYEVLYVWLELTNLVFYYCGHLIPSLFVQLLYRKFSGNFLVNLLGKWKESEYSGQSIPVGGLAYYVTAPSR